jgi:hypothetical protein
MKREEKADSFFYRLECETLEKGLLPNRLVVIATDYEPGSPSDLAIAKGAVKKSVSAHSDSCSAPEILGVARSAERT